MLFSEKKNIFKCLAALLKLLQKIFSCVWFYSENAIFLQNFHIFSAIFLATKQVLLQKISKSQPNPNPRNKSQPNPNTTHHQNSNSTHDSKLQQSKATTTKTPLPHHHNNNRNQNHTQREIGGSKVRSRRGEIERHGAINAVLRSTRPMRSGACDHQTGARGSLATSKA